MVLRNCSLQEIVKSTDTLQEIYKSDVTLGDVIIAYTVNSTYRIRVLGSGRYKVSGGWFDKIGISPIVTTISGCTWGGSAIKKDIIAACGLCLEFGNKVVTSTIRRIAFYKNHLTN